uniref:LRRCT domain-containing protein n=1 Tax=Knipowitschia caucasica TaxID=637954 RepID=A0AAV2JVP8_KNICA
MGRSDCVHSLSALARGTSNCTSWLSKVEDVQVGGVHLLLCAVVLPGVEQFPVRDFILMTSSVSYLFTNTLEDSPQLCKLIFLNNAIRSVHSQAFEDLVQLQDLEISGNPWLEHLYLGTFSKQHNLTNLMLNYNRLKTANNLSSIQPKLFEDQALIEQLNLSDNRLQTLPEGLMDTFSVQHMLRLHGNPWKCDCGLWYLHDWVLRNGQNVEMLDRTLCESPAFLNRRSMDSVEREQLVCHMGKDHSVDVRNCLMQVSGDAVIIKCKVETCLPLAVKVQLQDELGNVKEHVVRNEWTDSAQCSNMTLE